jgi:hypothetical protein
MDAPARVNAHDLISLVAAATLIYYRITPSPLGLNDRKARDDIHRLCVTLAGTASLYRVDFSGAVRPIEGDELAGLVKDIARSHVLDDAEGADLAIHTADLASTIEAELSRRPE